MADSDDVRQVARDMVLRYGAEAVRICPEKAEYADCIGDTLSAEAWRDIGDDAEGLLKGR
jgi:hypothetical protein